MYLKLAFLLVMLLLVGLGEFISRIAVSTDNGVTTYSFSIVSWYLPVVMAAAFVGFGEYVRRKWDDKWGALIFYAGVPMMAFLSLQYVYEQVRVSDDKLVYTREPPHTDTNATIEWNQIVTATKVQRESQYITGGRYFRYGYRFSLKDGKEIELPLADTLSAAVTQIDAKLETLGVPSQVEVIPLGQQNRD